VTKDAFSPMLRQSLSETLAQRIRGLIQSGDYRKGDRLPPIMEMARRFGVGHPTVREALKKLEAFGIVEIRHGSGVYVSAAHDVLVHHTTGYTGTLTKTLLMDLVEARMPIEMQSIQLAAHNATEANLLEMRRLLARAGKHLHDDAVLSPTNMAFHHEIALASGNTVLPQLLHVLAELFTKEQRLILDIYGSREKDHQEHLGILEALERKDEELSTSRMRMHLEGIREVLRQWNPDQHPVS
jgi:GntR family transcriptional regulator, transcriptional repressor for pyruvate dehydrogenase complex